MMKSTHSGERAFWPWLLQRVSAVFLLVLVVAHLWIEHFMHLGQPITYQSVARRLMRGLFDAVDYGLLIVVVYHALNGVRNIWLDRGWSRQRLWVASTMLWVIGLATVVVGADIVSAFLNKRPWFYL
jgi:succinate dehydrogenase cytochrome b556 subunit